MTEDKNYLKTNYERSISFQRMTNKITLIVLVSGFIFSEWRQKAGAADRGLTFKNLQELPLLVRLFRRILMNALTKAAAHGLGQKDCGVTVFIAQAVRRGKSTRPFLFLIAFQ